MGARVTMIRAPTRGRSAIIFVLCVLLVVAGFVIFGPSPSSREPKSGSTPPAQFMEEIVFAFLAGDAVLPRSESDLFIIDRRSMEHDTVWVVMGVPSGVEEAIARMLVWGNDGIPPALDVPITATASFEPATAFTLQIIRVTLPKRLACRRQAGEVVEAIYLPENAAEAMRRPTLLRL